MTHKSGFVNIIGNPNVGKSTLMNALVGEKLSIITSKAQTTRHRLMGIVNGEDFQIVYSDTPGILKPAYKLQQAMMKFVETALEDADIILYVTDTVETPNKNQEFLNKLQQLGKPIVLAINKVDLTTQEKVQELFNLWSTMMPNATVIPISALHGFNLNSLVDFILDRLPEGPEFFPKDTLTDKTLRFFASEIIREKILNNYRKEIPYSVEVEIEQYTESDTIDRIKAIIYVERESQKSILIGHQGNMLKKVGTEARLELEAFLGKKVYLELFVKVNENWRNDTSKLKRFGYPL
ncbi:MAG TPA: GTPase Era [Tenuifilaceae bacterium]|jgi:GTP-binding protein Era|nr:GTPase Era [Bacteroidales bacterium]HNY08621.1 GTPase Era [Tenuifilaceae bacterium]MBP8643842.1 GTPase Era [Bacteroidales bacterium]HOA09538.1 GTPase Era [Tenuifilaceae bacterium]HOC36403.1 GTPase Era [Tenuifilaceae bacterium]